jgi:hypothetical protein
VLRRVVRYACQGDNGLNSEPEPQRILVERTSHSSDLLLGYKFYASVDGVPEWYGYVKTGNEAIGDLVRKHQLAFGIEIESREL